MFKVWRLKREALLREKVRLERMRSILNKACDENRHVWVYFAHGEGGYAGQILREEGGFYHLIDSKRGTLFFDVIDVTMIYVPIASHMNPEVAN